MYLIFLWSMLLTNWKTIPIVVFKINHFSFLTQHSSIGFTLKSIWNACSNWRVVPLYFHCMYMHVCMHYSRAFLFFNLSIFCLNNTLILHFSGCYIMHYATLMLLLNTIQWNCSAIDTKQNYLFRGEQICSGKIMHHN